MHIYDIVHKESLIVTDIFFSLLWSPVLLYVLELRPLRSALSFLELC